MTNNKIVLFVLLMSSCLLCCQSRQEHSFERKEISVNAYELVIPHGDQLLSAVSYTFDKAGKDSIVLLDGASKSFVIADTRKQEIVKSIDYEIEGPNFTDFPIFDLRWSKNHLFVLSKLYFSVYDTEGQVQKRFALRDYEVLEPYFYHSFDIINDTYILLATSAKSAVYSGFYPAPDNDFIFASLNLVNGDLKPLPIVSPASALVSDSTRGYYNNFAEHIGHYNDSSIVYNFSYSSTIYKASIKGFEEGVYKAKSQYTGMHRKPIAVNSTPKKYSEYVYSEQPNYTAFMFDEVTGWYARVHGQVKGGENPKNQQYLMVFDEEMNVVFETFIPFETRVMARGNVFSNGKVYLLRATPPTEDAYHFTVFDFNEENIDK